jgi:hypothetical protein
LSRFIFGFCIIVDSYIPVLNIITLTTVFVYSLGVLYKNVVQFMTLLARTRALQWQCVGIVQLHKYTRNLTQLLTNQLTLQTVKHMLSRTTRQPDEANAPEDGKLFDLNVSGSESDGPVHPACQPCRRAQDATADAGVTEVDQQINNLMPVQDSKKAADTRHFFE